MNKWQPIETAPKDGTKIIVYNDDGSIYEACKDGDYWSFATASQHGCGCCGSYDDMPTYWMPLPDPPIGL